MIAMMRRAIVLFVILLLPVMAMAATGFVKGQITDAEEGTPIATAQVVLKGTNYGAATGLDGRYVIYGIPAGTYVARVLYLGFDTQEIDVVVVGGETATINAALEGSIISNKELTFFADRAKERETPVAFTTVNKADLQARLGSQDIPMVMNMTPGIYATEQGGGAGDSRINVRGFNQRNVAVMINGVPVNDMENGWVYWSNWDGLGDVTSSIELQRGLSAGNLSTPSVGGTMNILTDAAAMESGIIYKQEIGSDNFQKKTLTFSTGLIDEKFAMTMSGVRKTGDGSAQNLWTDSWGYFLGASYIPKKDHKIDFYAFGAPQQHGQRRFKLDIEHFDYDYAVDQGITGISEGDEFGHTYNQHWGYVNAEYPEDIKQYYNGKVRSQKFDGRLAESQNYYHKPQANLNYFWRMNPQWSLSNVAYLSIGKGGGSGFANKNYPTRYIDPFNGQVNWDDIIAGNKANVDTTTGDRVSQTILRNSVNEHFWIGDILKADYQYSDQMKFSMGLDYRYFQGFHYREVRNLLGGDVYLDRDNGYKEVRLGDKIQYDSENQVVWYGGFLQSEYTNGKLSTVLSAGANYVRYKSIGYITSAVNPVVDWEGVFGYQVKAGANYNVNNELNIFANAGYVNKAPNFDGVIDDHNYELNNDIQNELIIAIEGGAGYTGFDRKLRANINGYYTMWNDRTWTGDLDVYYDVVDDTGGVSTERERDVFYFMRGVDALHMGVEFDFKYQPVRQFQLSGMASIGNWKWTDDSEFSVSFTGIDGSTVRDTTQLYTKDIKVADAAQTTFMLGGTLYPIQGLRMNLTWKHFANHYANFDPMTRSKTLADGVTPDREQPWMVPDYSLFDLHVGYYIPNSMGVQIEISGHVFNLLDELYISDADDYGSYNKRTDRNNPVHDATTAQVFFGRPRTWNMGLQITF
jgi:iron complex outermembrane recepter protein